MGLFPLWPLLGCDHRDIEKCPIKERWMSYKLNTVKARPGYFALKQDNDIDGEMTAANRTALYRFKFPQDTNSSTVSNFGPIFAIELADLPNTRKEGGAFVDQMTGRIVGNGTFNPICGIGTFTPLIGTDEK